MLIKILKVTSYRSSFIIYTLLFLLLTFRYWGNGEVIAPYRQFGEIALADTSGARQIENHIFSDFVTAYIPETKELLESPRSSWLTLWSNQNELGRQIYHVCRFSPAYLPSWIFAHFTDNPWRCITVLSLLTCFFAGVFVILFCRELGLSSLAGLIAGINLAASPLFMYWITFPMFSAVWCWAAGALWAVTRLARKSDLVSWGMLAFSIYSLLMTAYPQPVVFHAYILACYGAYLTFRKKQIGSIEIGRFLIFSLSALSIGVALAMPVYIDLMNITTESARVSAPTSFFVKFLPKFDTLTEALQLFALGTTPELFGNPIEPNYPLPYDGVSVTPIIVFFAVICLLTSIRKTWGWWLAFVTFYVIAFIHPLYAIGVKYFGFNLSPINPIGNNFLPLIIINAYGVDALVKRTIPGELSRVVWIAAGSVLGVISIGLGFGISQEIPLRWGMVLVMFLLVVLLASHHQKTRPVFLLVALAIMLTTISYPLMLHQNPNQIATTSPLIERIRTNLPADSRFAIAKPGISFLSPNLNAGFGLASVHSYNSLSSKRYQTLIKLLGGEMGGGVKNTSITPDYNSSMFWMSNIGLMLSPIKLAHENLESLGEESGVHLYKVISRMGESIQLMLLQTSIKKENVQISDLRHLPRNIPRKTLDQGDLLEFEVAPGIPSILILSQKYHRDWEAHVFDKIDWIPAKSTVINGVFQGVFLPQNVQRVRLKFKPYASYAWIAHVFWSFFLALIGIKAWQRKGCFGNSGISSI